MKIKRSELQRALELVKPGLANKDMIEQATSFAFINGDVVTFNDEISIRHPIDGLEIEGAIKAEEMYQLLSKLKKEEIEVEATDTELNITCGKTKAGLTLHSEITLPIDSISKKGKWKKVHENFTPFIKMAMGACGTDMSRPILTCVHVHEDGIIEGSDSMKIMRCELPEKSPVKTFLLPARAAAILLPYNPTYIADGEGWIHFKTESDTEISIRIFEDEFPNTDTIVNVEGKTMSFPKTFADMLERAAVFSKRDHIIDESVTIRIDDNKIKIKAASIGGWIEEEANMRYKDDPIEFNIAPYLLKGILNETHDFIINEDKLKFEGDGWSYITLLFND